MSSTGRVLGLIVLPLIFFCSCSRVNNSVQGVRSRFSNPFSQSYSGIRTAQAAIEAAEDLTPDYEYRLGRAVAAQLISSYGIDGEREKTKYINLVGHVLASYSDRPEVFAGYHFIILDTAERNAFAAPGAFIFITRGLLERCTNEDELAAVLAHEIAHVQSKHALRSIENARLTTFLNRASLGILTSITGLSDFGLVTVGFTEAATAISDKILNSGYSREMELEADSQALQLLHRAGYDPAALPQLLERLAQERVAGGLALFATHDSPEHRLAALKDTGIPTVTSRPPSNARAERFASKIHATTERSAD